MALANVPPFYIPSLPLNASSSPGLSGTSYRMDAASEVAAIVCRAPKAGNIAKVGFRVHAVTSAPSSNHTISIQGVSATTGLNDGTPLGGGSPASATALLNSTGWKLITLDNAATVTAGQLIAVCVTAPGANFGDIGLSSFDDERGCFPYGIAVTTKLGGNVTPNFTLEYSDGSYEPIEGVYPYSVINTINFNNTTNPNRRALRFQLGYAARLAGCWLWANPANDFDIVFYSGGASATVVLSVDKDETPATVGIYRFQFTTKPSLSAGTNYRLAIVPTTGSNIGIFDADVHNAATLGALPGGADFHLSTVNGTPSAEGDWTQFTTLRPFMGLLIDQIDYAPTGGGVGASIFGGGVVR